mgnify:CR=1 FL=1
MLQEIYKKCDAIFVLIFYVSFEITVKYVLRLLDTEIIIAKM